MEKERLSRYIVVALIIGIVSCIAYPYIRDFLLPLWNPLLDEKTRLVRYYACSLAICADGCGSEEVKNICLERDPGTRKCLKWCDDICKENGWNGRCCGKKYKINITLKNPIRFEGCQYKYNIRYDRYEVLTNSYDISILLNKTEKFPVLSDFFKFQTYGSLKKSGDKTKSILDQGNESSGLEGSNWDSSVFLIPQAMGTWYKCGAFWNGGYLFILPGTLHLINETTTRLFADGIVKYPSERIGVYKYYVNSKGIGAIQMIPENAYVDWKCHTTTWNKCPEGFYECEYKGKISIYSIIPCIGNKLAAWDADTDTEYPCSENGIKSSLENAEIICPDVFFEPADKPFAGGFNISIEPNETLITLGEEAKFNVSVKNNLGFDSEFHLEINSPEKANCSFADDEDKTSIFVRNDSQGFKDFVCKPENVGSYTIEVVAWDGAITHLAQAELKVGDFYVSIEPHEKKTLYVNFAQSYTVKVNNSLGKDAKFNLSLTANNDLGCSFDSTNSDKIEDFFVAKDQTEETKFTCTPNENTAGKNYKIEVTGKYESLRRSDSVKVKVASCIPPEGDLTVSLSSTTAGEDSTITASGFKDCPNKNAQFFVSLLTDDGKRIEEQSIGSVSTGKKSVSITKTLGNPGKYVFKVKINFDVIEKSGEKEVTVTSGTPRGKDCSKCNDEWCSFSLGTVVCWDWDWVLPGGEVFADICDKCTGDALNPVENCPNSCDPQSCYQDSIEGSCAKASNICCISGEDYYSPGPPDVPCLSPDTNTHNDENDYFKWKGVDNPRNVLVLDNDVGIECDPNNPQNCFYVGERNSYATFKWDVFCTKDSDCGLSDAKCIEIPDDDHPSDVKDKKACKLKGFDDDYWFTSWLYIRIVDEDRPVYGIKIVSRGDCPLYNKVLSFVNEKFELFLHKHGGGWIHVASPVFTDIIGETKIFRPSDSWAWEGIDGILLAHKYNYESWLQGPPPYKSESRTSDSWIDYIGLLTKGANISYCTDKPKGINDESKFFYRTVDNGVKCYWGLDCEDGKDQTGWSYDGTSEGIKPLQDMNNVCDCSDNDNQCGKGYCSFSLNEKQYCYYGVKCAHGGWWPEGLQECKDDEVCTWKGCV